MSRWPRSLQGQLALRLTAVFLVAIAAGIGALFFESVQTADALRRQELLQRARQVAQLLQPQPDGTVRISFPPGDGGTFGAPGASDLFLVRSGVGKTLVASNAEAARALVDLPFEFPEPRYVRSRSIGQAGLEYCALTVRAESKVGPVSVTVARPLAGDALAHAVLERFVFDIAWAIPLFAAAMLAVGVWSIRRSLRPLVTASAHAAAIGPATSGVRLSVDRLPTELVPLVTAINQALDRLEQSLLLQREFTANAAHQLRTPLTILTAQLEELNGGLQAEKLREDAARMNRLIDQLLRVARLDAIPIAISPAVDLKEIAAESARFLAPWAIRQNRLIGFDAPDEPVLVRGNADAIGDALRNLMENAICHTPIDTEVTMTVSDDGAVAVADRGSGVPFQDRQRIFERFWRGRATPSPGAGLGLAIVAQIAKAHDGTIEVTDREGGGTIFTLKLQAA